MWDGPSKPAAKALSVQTGGRFSTLPARALADLRLSPMTVYVLSVLAITESTDHVQRRDGWFEISQGILAVLAGLHRTNLNRHLQVLIASGYLEKRQTLTETGAKGVCLYRIVFDGHLPREHDRWSGLDGEEEQSVPSASPNNGRDASDASGGKAPDGPDPDAARAAAAGQVSLKETNVREAGEDDDDVATVIDRFLDLRKRHFPNDFSGISKRDRLAEQIREWLSKGLSTEAIAETLDQGMEYASSLGHGAPASINAYCRNLEAALEARDDDARGVEPLPSPSRPVWTEEERAAWNRVGEAILARGGELVDPLWIWRREIRFGGVKGGKIVIFVPAQNIADQVAPCGADLKDLILREFASFEPKGVTLSASPAGAHKGLAFGSEGKDREDARGS